MARSVESFVAENVALGQFLAAEAEFRDLSSKDPVAARADWDNTQARLCSVHSLSPRELAMLSWAAKIEQDALEWELSYL